MRDIRPSAEYMNEIMHQVKVSTSISPMISEMLRSVRISSVSEIYERYSSIMDPIQESLKGIDMELLGSVADRVLTMSEDLDLDVGNYYRILTGICAGAGKGEKARRSRDKF